jgi:hypothetical protein
MYRPRQQTGQQEPFRSITSAAECWLSPLCSSITVCLASQASLPLTHVDDLDEQAARSPVRVEGVGQETSHELSSCELCASDALASEQGVRSDYCGSSIRCAGDVKVLLHTSLLAISEAGCEEHNLP